jgi:hypothetical protein
MNGGDCATVPTIENEVRSRSLPTIKKVNDTVTYSHYDNINIIKFYKFSIEHEMNNLRFT